MTIQKEIDNYKKVADALGDDATKAFIETIRQTIGSGECFLPFIGQFSAGKSKLINNLIGKSILPTKSSETTAFLTYLRYGEEESATITFTNDNIETIDIERVKDYYHKDTIDSSKTIKSMDITIDCDILKGGLVFVDTPGVNTLVNDHVAMTEELLSSICYAIYVMGGALTAQDCLMINKMVDLGIKCVFVRTKMDQIHKSEEKMYETIGEDKRAIEDKFGKSIDYFAITNEDLSVCSELLSENFSVLKSFISLDISNNIKKIYEDIINKRLERVRKSLEMSIVSREKLDYDLSAKTNDELLEQQKVIEKKQKELEKIIESNLSGSKLKADIYLNDIKRKVDSIISKQHTSFEADLSRLSLNEMNDIDDIFKDKAMSATDSMSKAANQMVNEFSAQYLDGINANLKDISVDLEKSGIDINCEINMEIVNEYADKQQSLVADFNDKITNLCILQEMSDNELSEIDIKRENIERAINEFNNFIKEGEDAINQIDASYEPQFIENESRLGRIFKGFGKVCDVAMLLIPGKGWAMAGAKVGKCAGTLSKGGKLAQQAGKALGGVQKGLKVLEGTDRVKDAATLMKGLDNVMGGGGAIRVNKKDNSVLDYLSLSFWFEKVGKSIDPDTKEINLEYQNQVDEAKRQIKIETEKYASQKLIEMRELGLIKTAAEEARIRKEQCERQKSVEQSKLDNEMKKLNIERDRNLRKSISKQSLEQFDCILKEYAAVLMSRVESETDSICKEIISATNQHANEQLDNISSTLKDIICKREETSNAKETNAKRWSDLKELLCA